MARSLFSRLFSDRSHEGKEIGPELSLAMLLVHAAQIDDEFDLFERERIPKILAAHFEIGEFEAWELMDKAEIAIKGITDTQPIASLVKKNFDHDERIGIMSDLWEVVLADGQRSDDENALMRLLAKLLGVSDKESALARKNVIKYVKF